MLGSEVKDMATIVNNPAPSGENNGGMGFIVGALILLLIVFLFFYYGLPAMRGAVTPGSSQINVPGKVDVNINKK